MIHTYIYIYRYTVYRMLSEFLKQLPIYVSMYIVVKILWFLSSLNSFLHVGYGEICGF